MNRILLYGLFLLGIIQSVAAQQPADSVYRRMIQCGRDSLNCYLAYPVNDSRVTSGFGNNDNALENLDNFITCALNDTLVCVRSVRLTGYCSIDGPYAVNRTLAIERTNGMKAYLNGKYGLSARYPVEMDYVAEDWTTLRRLIDGSAYPWREAALQVIDHTPVFEGREAQLMKLDGGEAFREMKQALFPRLRRVEVRVEYDLRRIIEKRYKRKMDETEFREVLQQERQAITTDTATDTVTTATTTTAAAPPAIDWKKTARNIRRERIRMERMKFRPLIGVKTNLALWAGITPKPERTTFMPNLAAEVFFAKRYSAEVSALFSDFDFGKGEHWGLSGYSVEPRIWLKADGRYRGLYAGLYGQAGDFNTRRTDGNHTGTYLQAGLSVGYYLMLTRHWGIEPGVRGGYQKADVTRYVSENGHYYLYGTEGKTNDTRWGLMEIDVNVSYRF